MGKHKDLMKKKNLSTKSSRKWQPGSGNTSENNSLMGDTPSNYNEANLRFHTLNAKNKEELDKLDETNEEDD